MFIIIIPGFILIMDLTNAMDCDFSNQNLTEVKKYLNPQCERVDLSNNKLTYLNSGMLQGLISVRHIALYNNRIRNIGLDTFKAMPLVIDIQLEDNNIESLAQGAFAGPNLKYLQLHNNNLKIFPWTALADLDNLTRPTRLILSLSGNREFQCTSPQHCWLKQGEKDGSVEMMKGMVSSFHPDCTNSSTGWDSLVLQCPNKGKSLVQPFNVQAIR